MKKAKIGAFYESNGRYLCPMEKEFLPKLKKWRNLQIKVLRQSKPLTDCDQEKWFESLSHNKDQVIFGILAYDENCGEEALIGYCGITNIDFRNRRGEVSFLVDPNRADDERLYREDFLSVLRMLCRYGFEELNLNKLFAETFSFRTNHMQILEEFGFKSDGVLRSHHFTNGGYVDSIIHSILVFDWKQHQEKNER